MISHGELTPGQHFVLVDKPAPVDEEAANWSQSLPLYRMVSGAPAASRVNTQVLVVRSIDLPLVLVETLGGQHTVINVEQYDLREVKPELVEAIRNLNQRGGATVGEFEKLSAATAEGFEHIKKVLASHSAALEARPIKRAAPWWREPLIGLTWAAIAFAIFSIYK